MLTKHTEKQLKLYLSLAREQTISRYFIEGIKSGKRQKARLFNQVVESEHLGSLLTNLNVINDEIRYYSVQ